MYKEVQLNVVFYRSAKVLFTVLDSQMVLLHGFVKKSQKMPQKDLDIAKRRKSVVEQGHE